MLAVVIWLELGGQLGLELELGFTLYQSFGCRHCQFYHLVLQ